MAETTATAPTLVKDQVASLLVGPLEAQSVVLSSGVRIFDSSEPLKIPALVSGTEPSYVAEGAEIPDDHDVNFGEISLMPTSRKAIKTILRFSNELLRAATIGLDAVLKQRLVADVTNKLDHELLTGSGVDGAIRGIINQPGTATGTLDVADADSLLDALATATANEVTPNRWFISGADFAALRKLKTATGSAQYLLESDLTKDATYRLFGLPVVVTNKLPEGTAILANTAEIAVVRDINPTVTVLTERYAEFDEVGIRVTARYDLGALHPAGIVKLTATP